MSDLLLWQGSLHTVFHKGAKGYNSESTLAS